MRHLIRKHLSTLPQKQVLFYITKKKELQWKFDSCANEWKSFIFRKHWLSFLSFFFCFHSLGCFSCHASHGNFRCAAINWIYSQKSSALKILRKEMVWPEVELFLCFFSSKIELFPHLLLWRWQQLQDHLILILPNDTGTPNFIRCDTRTYAKISFVYSLHTITFMLYFLLHEQMLLGLIGLLTSFWWDRLINVGYKAHFAHSTKQQDQQCFALQNCGYFHVSASQEKAEKMVLEGGQFYLMEHHGSLCWLLLFATLDKIVFSPNKVYQGQQPATKKLHQQQRYFLFSLNTHRIWSTLLKA